MKNNSGLIRKIGLTLLAIPTLFGGLAGRVSAEPISSSVYGSKANVAPIVREYVDNKAPTIENFLSSVYQKLEGTYGKTEGNGLNPAQMDAQEKGGKPIGNGYWGLSPLSEMDLKADAAMIEGKLKPSVVSVTPEGGYNLAFDYNGVNLPASDPIYKSVLKEADRNGDKVISLSEEVSEDFRVMDWYLKGNPAEILVKSEDKTAKFEDFPAYKTFQNAVDVIYTADPYLKDALTTEKRYQLEEETGSSYGDLFFKMASEYKGEISHKDAASALVGAYLAAYQAKMNQAQKDKLRNGVQWAK